MVYVIIAALLCLAGHNSCRASDSLLGVSPDGNFGVLNGTSSEPCLVSLPSRKIVLQELLNSQGDAMSVLWSKDSSSFACWVQQARFTALNAYRRDHGTFVLLSVPEPDLPIEKALRRKKYRTIGESEAPLRWVNRNTLVLNRYGLINLYDADDNPIDHINYDYDLTIVFDKSGVGRVAKIKRRTKNR